MYTFKYEYKYFSKFQDAIDESSASMDGDETPVVDEIPGSTTLWEATPRPSNSSNVDFN